ncbi:hypothetical protein EC973_009415 [Apophysomyces ossiformis]|uniref:Ras GEF n=1 Tax=Apophysomyces ossiformis TaxID=679940 RepID=A0A8H7BP58_9FUNG|nr:hypothetical protein EC973_009415 [Apophysomyces ossiformis]
MTSPTLGLTFDLDAMEGEAGFPEAQILHPQRGTESRWNTDQQRMRLSMNSLDPVPTSPGQSNWILQTTEDGSETYYYNIVTKEMRYSVPPDELYYTSKPALDETYQSYQHAEHEDEFDERIARPARAINRLDRPQKTADEQSIFSTGTVATSTSSSPSIHTSKSVGEEQVDTSHVSFLVSQTYSVTTKLVTDQTTWNMENIDPQSGLLISRSARNDEVEGKTNNNCSINNDQTPMSWSQLSTLIAHAIHNLKNSVKDGQIELFREDAVLVVQRIRLLLYVSNSIDKENSPYLKSNKQLRSYHRALLAALAKLVLSAKVASDVWSSPESTNKLHVDADDVLTAVRDFLTAAQDMRLEICDSKPRLLQDNSSPSRWRPDLSNGIHGSNPDPATTLLVLADNVRGAASSFMEGVREAFSSVDPNDNSAIAEKINTNAPLLVAQFRNLSNTTSQFLNSVETISNNHPKQADQFIETKQTIYSAMGSLFILSQAITNQDSANDVESMSHQLESCISSIENSVLHICSLGRQLTDVEPTTAESDLPSEYNTERRPSLRNSRYNLDSYGGPSLHRRFEIATDSDQGINIVPEEWIQTGQSSSADVGMQSRQAKDKLAKFFGEDTIAAARRRDTVLTTPTSQTFNAPTAPSSPNLTTNNNTSEKPDFLGSDYNPNEIIFNMEGNVKGGTVTSLVQRLTQHDQLDSKFITTFLLTYRSFCTTEELFDALFKRYTMIPPPNLTSEEIKIWQEKKLKLVRLRVFNVIKSWLDTYYIDEEDRPYLAVVYEFADTVVRESIKFGADQLIKLVKKRMEAEDGSQLRKMTLNVRETDMVAPILPKNMKRLRFLEIDPLELARQLTIMDFRLYSCIKPVECLDKNWGKGDSEHIAANVKASIEYSNQVTAWVTDSILSKEEVKRRAAVAKHWIYVAEKCRQLNNYNTCMAILSAFDNSAIGRLRRTWELMSARTMQILSSIRHLMGANKNFTEYRDIIHKVNPPCIPFLGIYLQDLTFIEDGNSNYLKKSNNLINFAKRMKTAEVIRELQQYQSTPYLLQAVPDIQEFIKTHLQSSRDDETLYNMSLTVEPRERGEDTIARRLKESGL